MAVTSGAITSVTQVAANQMPDKDRMLYMIKPYQTPLYQKLMFGGTPSKVVINQNGKFDSFEDFFLPHQTTLTGAGISGGAASEDNIGLTDATIFTTNDILLVELTEQMVYVDSVAGGAVDITHIDGSTNIIVAATGYVKKVGTRLNEADSVRTAMSTKEVEVSNYCQMFSETVKTTGRAIAGDLYTNGRSHKDQLKKKIEEMKLMFERAFKFNTSSGTVTDATTNRFTYGVGLLGRITTNTTQYAGALSEDTLLNAYETVSELGSNHKTHYVGTSQLTAINKIVKDKYAIDPKPITTTYGVKVRRIEISTVMVDLVWDPSMDGKFKNWGFILDNDQFKLRHMANDNVGSRKFRIVENPQVDKIDGQETFVLSDIGMQFNNESKAAMLYQA